MTGSLPTVSTSAPDVAPLISVFFPTYNHEEFIAEALDSVLAQGYSNMEVIIGDDASTDATLSIAESYRQRHPNIIKILQPTENLGVTRNCNRILGHCHGDYIAFISGDDIWLPGKLQAQIDLFKRNLAATICFTGADVFQSDSGEIIVLHAKTGQQELLKSDPLTIIWNIGPLGSAMVKASAVPKSGFDERIPMASDWLFFSEIACRGSVVYVDEILTRYRRHAGNVSTDFERLIIEVLMSTYYLADRMPDYAREAQNIRWRKVHELMIPHYTEVEKVDSTLREEVCIKLMQKVRISKLAKILWGEFFGRAMLKVRKLF